MNICIVETTYPTHLTVTSLGLDAFERTSCRLTLEAILTVAAVVRVCVRTVALDRNVVEGIRVSSVNATECPCFSFPLISKQS